MGSPDETQWNPGLDGLGAEDIGANNKSGLRPMASILVTLADQKVS
jgi:hypothetical protein